jgi:hypothetical protein
MGPRKVTLDRTFNVSCCQVEIIEDEDSGGQNAGVGQVWDCKTSTNTKVVKVMPMLEISPGRSEDTPEL